MATSDAKDAAARERIIKHMNADHQDSIRRYVEHANNASFFQLRDARLTDIDLNGMTVSYASKKANIPFDPPMKSMSEVRERVMQMDKDALKALGRSDIAITSFVPCYTNLFHLYNFSQCFLTYLAYSRSANFKPGSLLFDHILFRFPRFAKFSATIQPYLISIMVAIHLFESVLMMGKLRKHGLTPLEKLWWLWVGTCFVEGITSFRRLDGWIEERNRDKEAKAH